VPLDEFLPRFDFSEHHATEVAASPERTLAAAVALSARDTPVTLGLMALRRLPARLKARFAGRGRGPQPSPRPVLDQMERAGFVRLAERRGEVVFGVVGRFWELGSGLRPVTAADFVTFAEPGYAKAVIDFRVEPAPGGCLLSTETRIAGTDEDARRTFGRYWRVIHPGSALIRREWLRAIRRRAEREAGG
jgi:hypothetical protein